MKSVPSLPAELIFFVTSHCNLRCRHCFNWQNLQRGRDLNLAEIEALARSLPTLKNLMLSGGEPFLRTDLVEICRLFATHGRIAAIDIPTAGTLVERTVATVEEILRIEPAFTLQVGISLDGMEAHHDRNRGAPGTFAKAVDCCRRLLELKSRSSRLKVNILTTLTADNRDELHALKEFVARSFPALDNLYWGVARGDVRVPEEGAPTLADLDAVDREFLTHDEQRKKGRGRALARRFYALRRQALAEHRQPLPCVAASRIAVVYDDGSVAPCELLPPVGNIRDTSFEAIWSSAEMHRAREIIAAGGCACTHECFLYPSLEAFLLERPLTLVRLAGIDGLVRYLGAKCRLDVLAFQARKALGRRSAKRREETR